MAILDELNDALKEAMKTKEKAKLDAIRQVKSEIEEKRAEKGEDITDELVLGVIKSYVKKMTKAVEEYQSLGDRGTEMAEKIQFEIDFLGTWLPEQVSDEDVEKIVDAKSMPTATVSVGDTTDCNAPFPKLNEVSLFI